MKLLFIFPLLFASHSYAAYNLAGPYEISLEDFKDCDNVGTGQIRHVSRIRKVNATTRLLYSEADYKIPFGDNLSFQMATDKWTAGGWGKNAYNMDGDKLCSTYSDSAFELFEAYFGALGVAPQCPIPEGSYKTETGMGLKIKNFKKFPSLPYGRYRVEFKELVGEELVGCSQLIFNIEEIAVLG